MITAKLEAGVWWNKETGHIHNSAQGRDKFISTVNSDRGSARGNPNLYWKLARYLAAQGKPHPPLPSKWQPPSSEDEQDGIA